MLVIPVSEFAVGVIWRVTEFEGESLDIDRYVRSPIVVLHFSVASAKLSIARKREEHGIYNNYKLMAEAYHVYLVHCAVFHLREAEG